MTPQEFEASVLAEGYSPTVHLERGADFSLGDHQHPFDACALVTAGEFVITVGDDSRSYKAGDVFRLPAGTVHQERAGPLGASYIVGRREPGQA